MNYYNEFDKKTAAWLRELIAQGHLPKGHVDDRSIVDVQPGDLDGYVQCHFFAGIGGWPYALQLAGWPANEPVWTGSCPCQPFSCAGKRLGTKDERHLWPEMFRLISERKPPTVFGEQVASKAGREWLGHLLTDVESVGYAGAGADLCSAGIGADHIRQRLFWVADAEHDGHNRAEWTEAESPSNEQDGRIHVRNSRGLLHAASGTATIQCGDGKTRRIAPGITPVAHGIPARVVRLRGYGNAIDPRVASEFIGAFMDLEATQ